MNNRSFPGQEEVIFFSLEHVRSLTSSIRSDVFWTFVADEPMSVSDVANALGKSSSATHYHTNELLKSGLLLDVDSRRKGARTERLYVHSAKEFYSAATDDPDYRYEVSKGFNAVTRHLARERAIALDVIAAVPNSGLSSYFQHMSLRLSNEGLTEARQLLRQLYRELEALESKEGKRFHLSLHLNPTPQTSREVYRQSFGKEIKVDRLEREEEN